MDPEDVRELQNAYFAAVTPQITAYGGAVEKYIGDAILAVFGVPQAHEEDPERAVRAALAMQQAITILNDRLAKSSTATPALSTSALPRAQHLPDVLTSPLRSALGLRAPLTSAPSSLRIGVHTGLVVSDVNEQGDFVVTGDTVNLASRLQSAADQARCWSAARRKSASSTLSTANPSVPSGSRASRNRCRFFGSLR